MEGNKSILNQLVLSIAEMQCVLITYKRETDKKVETHKVQPYLLGLNNNDNVVLSAYYIPNSMEVLRGKSAGWKTYIIDNINSVKSVQEYFTDNKPEFNRNDKRMKQIICCIP